MAHIPGTRWLVVTAFAAALLTAPLTADAHRRHRAVVSIAPFPGDETGCLPDTERLQKCEKAVGTAAYKLIQKVFACHAKQASEAFDADRFNEEACEGKARAKFDERVADAVGKGGCAPDTASLAAELRDLLTEDPVDSLDARNAGIYCDSASGALIDPSGDDGGFVPSSKRKLRCANEVTDELGDLARDHLRCDIEAADHHEDGEDFDLEACEEAARAKFDSEIDETFAQSTCPACLDRAHQLALADSLVALLEANNALIFPCPEASPSGAFLEAGAARGGSAIP